MAEVPSIDTDDFARRFSMRSGNLMWLLGAGASASAGIPTAWHMIWEFKQQLFVSQRRVSLKQVSDLSNPSIRRRIQEHIDSSARFPAIDSSDEYAALFEAAYPAESDRRSYLDVKISGAQPSFGHVALATFMRAKRARLIWTTNFDPLIDDACARVFSTTGALTTVDLEGSAQAAQIIAAERWPVQIKLHGDFRSRRLKNTDDELRQQELQLRKALLDASLRFGLVVTGYSGRDHSIMDTLEEAVQLDGAFPAGLFWLNRGQDTPLKRVERLLLLASAKGIETGLVPVESFDEILRDLIRLDENIDTSHLDEFAQERERWSPAPLANVRSGWPIVRLNALQVSAPSVCRRIECNVAGYADIRELLQDAGLDLPLGRNRRGVLAFGSDSDLRRVFDSRGITEFDLHTIAPRFLKYDSAERGLLRDALTRAIVRSCALQSQRRGRADLLAPRDARDRRWMPLQRIVRQLTGSVPDHPELTWTEGLAIRLDWAADHLWLLFEPRTVFEGQTEENKAAATDFARERSVRRYNRQLEDLLAFWATVLSTGQAEVRALGVADGVDAAFRIDNQRPFSGRGQA